MNKHNIVEMFIRNPPRWIHAGRTTQFGLGSADQLGGCWNIYDFRTSRVTAPPLPKAILLTHLPPLTPLCRHTHTHPFLAPDRIAESLLLSLEVPKSRMLTTDKAWNCCWGFLMAERCVDLSSSTTSFILPSLSEWMLGWVLHYIFNYCQAAFESAFTTPFNRSTIRPGHWHVTTCAYSICTVWSVN